MKTENPMVADLMESIKVITDNYVAKLPAEKFTMKIKKIVTEDVVVDLPIYQYNTCHVYKVFSKDHCIQVSTLEGYESIGVKDASLAFHAPNNGECSEEKFLEAYEKTLLIIQNNIFSVEV